MKKGLPVLAALAAVAGGLLLSPPSASAQEGRQAYVGNMQVYVTDYEDTLVEVARRHNIGFNELRSANPFVDAWMPGDRTELILPTRHILPVTDRRGIVINLPEMRLYLFDKSGNVRRTHPIGVGREGLSTPVGRTTVVRKIEGPTWRPTDRMRREDPKLPAVVPPGPDNPMGTHALYLGWPQYAIHGTNKPYGIGRRSSSGCLRMYPEDIVALYPEAPEGTSVTVVNQPVKAAWINDRFYIEAHPPLDQANEIEESGGLPKMDLTEDDLAIILNAAGADVSYLNWGAIRNIISARQGYPVPVAERPAVKKSQVSSDGEPAASADQKRDET